MALRYLSGSEHIHFLDGKYLIDEIERQFYRRRDRTSAIDCSISMQDLLQHFGIRY